MEAFLQEVKLTGASLKKAILQQTDLKNAFLARAILENANLTEAILWRVKLNEGNLRRADLRKTDFWMASLTKTDFRKANITGAYLYGTAREGWIINSIICDFMYWDEAGTERIPQDRDFRPGEFEKLYKSLPTIEYYFEHGFTPIDAVLIDKVVQAVNSIPNLS